MFLLHTRRPDKSEYFFAGRKDGGASIPLSLKKNILRDNKKKAIFEFITKNWLRGPR